MCFAGLNFGLSIVATYYLSKRSATAAALYSFGMASLGSLRWLGSEEFVGLAGDGDAGHSVGAGHYLPDSLPTCDREQCYDNLSYVRAPNSGTSMKITGNAILSDLRRIAQHYFRLGPHSFVSSL